MDKFASAVSEIGPTFFINRCGGGAYVSPADFSAHLLDGAGPLVFADFLVSDPITCTARFSDGARSAALHALIDLAPCLPIVIGASLLGCRLHVNYLYYTIYMPYIILYNLSLYIFTRTYIYI